MTDEAPRRSTIAVEACARGDGGRGRCSSQYPNNIPAREFELIRLIAARPPQALRRARARSANFEKSPSDVMRSCSTVRQYFLL